MLNHDIVVVVNCAAYLTRIISSAENTPSKLTDTEKCTWTLCQILLVSSGDVSTRDSLSQYFHASSRTDDIMRPTGQYPNKHIETENVGADSNCRFTVFCCEVQKTLDDCQKE